MDLQGLADKIDVKGVETRIASLRAAALHLPSASFSENLTTITHLVALPHTLVMLGYAMVDVQAESLVAVARLAAQHRATDKRTNFSQSEIQDERKRLRDELSDPSPKEIDERVAPFLEFLTREEHEIDVAVRTILLSAISLIWTAFECAIKDAWIACLNARPLTLAHPTFERLPEGPPSDGLTSKQIQVGLLARYGFDVREVLGTLLSAKFDFTGIEGMKKAFASAFERHGGIGTLLEDAKLVELEQTRNLIVHKAAKVDDNFLRRTHASLKLGSPLPVSEDLVLSFVQAVKNETLGILEFLDQFLHEHPESRT